MRTLSILRKYEHLIYTSLKYSFIQILSFKRLAHLFTSIILSLSKLDIVISLHYDNNFGEV